MTLRSYEQLKPFTGKRVLVRCNFDVSVKDGEIDKDSTWRVDASLPLLRELAEAGALVTVISHRGRPEGDDPAFTLEPIVKYINNSGLSAILGMHDPSAGKIVVHENLRYSQGESENEPSFVSELASMGELFINDDFATAHRAHASTVGVAKLLPSAAGPLLLKEIYELTRAMEADGKGLCIIIGGAKAETKNKLVGYFVEKGADVLTGGVIANSVIKQRGLSVGSSMVDEVSLSKEIVSAQNLHVPQDVIVSNSLEKAENVQEKNVTEVTGGEYILDIGAKTQKVYSDLVARSSFVIWNGPMGLVEIGEFRTGSRNIAEACRQTSAYTLSGGGDIVTFLSQEGMRDSFDYVSTGGGAMLSFLAGERLPALDVLEEK